MANEICKFKPLHEMFRLPVNATVGSACFDLKYCGDQEIIIHSVLSAANLSAVGIKTTNRAAVSLGCAVEIPTGYELQLRPRSGLALKSGITILNSPGTIDSDYRGELKAIVVNTGLENFTVEPGMKICQALISKLSDITLVLVENISDTQRGSGGFGSTGV